MLTLMEKICQLVENYEQHLLALLKQNNQLIGLVEDIRDNGSHHIPLSIPPAQLDTDDPSAAQILTQGNAPDIYNGERDAYRPEELITVKEAAAILNVSRWKVDDMRDKNKLTSLERNRRIRLIRREVEAAVKWYSIPKGKV